MNDLFRTISEITVHNTFDVILNVIIQSNVRSLVAELLEFLHVADRGKGFQSIFKAWIRHFA